MLTIRFKRTGRSGHAQFRVIVQDSHFSPSGGRIVAYVGSYDPHTKATTLDAEKISGYLANGAQPSDRVARLLKKEGVKLPAWVKLDEAKKRTIRNPEKLRRNRPPEAAAPEKPVDEVETPAEGAEPTPAETPAEESTPAENLEAPADELEVVAEETAPEPAAEAPEEAPAAEAKAPDVEEKQPEADQPAA